MDRTNRWPLLLRLKARLALGSSAGAALVARLTELQRGLAAAHEQWRWRDPRCLQHFERSSRSENGEDGILREIFRRLDGERPGARTFVEFGVGDGRECCTRALVEEGGWRGVWFEAHPELAARAREAIPARSVTVLARWLTADNLLDGFAEAQVPREPDLMVVDVDGNDYWLLDVALHHRFSPRVVVVEYNSALGAYADWVMPYDPDHHWDGTGYFGASLRALARMMGRHGYTLVGCDSHGTNAFFVRRALVDERTWRRPGDVAYHCASTKYHVRQVFGDPTWFPGEPEMRVVDRASLGGVGVRLVGAVPSAVGCGARFTVALRVQNGAPVTLRTTGPNPVFASYRWRDENGAMVIEKGRLSRLLPRVDPGASRITRVAVTAPDQPGSYALTVTLLQAGNVWLDRLRDPVAAHARIAVH